MRKQIVAGNWKMNGNIQQITELLQQLLALIEPDSSTECIVMPPSIYLPLVNEHLAGSAIVLGAQNVYPKDAGAYTGELSGLMLRDYHCQYVLVGHSERRRLFAESEKFVAEKFHHVKEHGMIPVLCIGETLEEREQGLANEVIAKQIRSVGSEGKECFNNCIIAYEPIWAIGTGQTASPSVAQTMHASIRKFVAEFGEEAANSLPILYGGSVNEKNASELFAMPDIDGGLIGGASLNAQQFVDIIKCIN